MMVLVNRILGNFKKFSLNYSDFPTMVDNLAIILRFSSIRIGRRERDTMSGILEILNVIGAACHCYVYLVSAVWFLFVRFPQTRDYVAASVEISLAMCSGTSILKYIYLKIDNAAVIKLIDECLKCDAHIDSDTRFAKNLKKKLRVVKKRAILFWSALILNVIIYIMCPFLKSGRNLTENLYVIYGLEPILESPNFEIASFVMIAALTFGILIIANYRLLITTIIGYIEAQLLALSEDLLKLWEDSEQFYKEIREETQDIIETLTPFEVKNVYIEHHLREIIKFHIIDITLQRSVDNKFRFIYVIEFLFAMVGIVTELLGGLENTYVQLPYSLNQVFLDCLIGQRLIDAGKVFERAIYECKWENYNAVNQKTVLLMLLNAQKTLMLSAGGLTSLNFVCLMSVIRGTYSCYTALHSIIK